MNQSCLIITSCIKPFSSFVELKDPIERELLHISALKRWILESNFKSIIICDNSNYVYTKEFQELASKNNKELEILAFNGNQEKGLEHGKGYGEGELMEYVMRTSQIIKNYDSFFKVTGKLFVENCLLINNINNIKNSDFIFSIPIINIFSKRKISLVHTTFYYAKVEAFMLHLKDAYLKVRDNEGIYLEHVYFNSLKNIKSNSKLSISPMIPMPIVTGVSGSTGDFYYMRNVIKEKIINMLLPTFLIKKIKSN